MRTSKLIVALFGLMTATTAMAQTQSPLWRVERTEWSASDEANYQKFIANIGESIAKKACNTVTKCMTNPTVNPYHATDPDNLKLFSDCADLPYFLRAYFSWKNALPFGYIRDFKPNVIEGEIPNDDERYSKHGNIVTARSSVIARKGTFGVNYVDVNDVLGRSIPNQISSGTLRMGYDGMDADGLFTDMYPIKINSDYVKPGTVLYDPNGHVAVVYKVTTDGRVYYIDAHPDNSITTGLYNNLTLRSNPGQGAGFKNWRPIRLVNATYDTKYGQVGGQIIGAKNDQLPGFSMEQFYGTNNAVQDWKKSEFVFNNKRFTFTDFVRNRLATGTLKINPVDDFKVLTQQLCASGIERVDAVQAAFTAGIPQQAHPANLPKNIFGADGDWEAYATPSRDARLKTSFKELYTYAVEALKHLRAKDGYLDYQGTNLAADLLKVYQAESTKCQITYTNSNNQKVSMNLEQLRSRAYDISFDPYHCVELRWGAKGNEAASCSMSADNMEWYKREKWLRFQLERTPDVEMGFSLDQLTGPLPGAGVAAPQDLDVVSFLKKNMQ